MKYIKILSALLLSILVVSCNQGTNTSLNGGTQSTVPWVIPNVETAYVFELNGANPNIHPVDTIFILTTGQHIGGKTNVIGYADHAGTIGTAFYNIEPDGDISYGDSNFNAAGATIFTWKTFPTGTKKPISDPVTDTTEGAIHIFQSDVRTFIGAENVTTLAGNFFTLHVRETNIDVITSNDSEAFTANDTAVTDTWFAPSIALQVKVTTSGITDGQATDQSETDLIKYLPK